MPNVISQIISQLGNLLEPISPFTKAVVGPALGVVTALSNWAISGSFNAVSIVSAAGGVLIGVVTYFAKNKTQTPVVPVPVPVAPVVKKTS